MYLHEKNFKTLTDTVVPMLSNNYKCRFVAEFYQVKIRRDKLADLINKYYDNRLDFKLACPISLLEHQMLTMNDYLNTLEHRADIEGIDL